jgi:hypothetical protein
MSIFRYFQEARDDEPIDGVRMHTTRSGTTSLDIRDLVKNRKFQRQNAEVRELAKRVVRRALPVEQTR